MAFHHGALEPEERRPFAMAIQKRVCPVKECGAPIATRTEHFHWVCTGTPAHRWKKEDLFYLRYRYETLEP